MEPTRRCLLTIHAHPDDEASKGAPTVAKYSAAGVHCVLVCCTGGEEGDVHNPAMDTPQVRADMRGVRERELDRAAEIIGYHEVVRLGYRDSGMLDTEANKHPESFAQADFDEAIGRLVAVVRRTRPQVLITYGEDHRGYPHPDHVRVHTITGPAVERAADPSWYPEAGEPWQVCKVYYTIWSRARMVATHEKMLELGMKSPFDDKWFERPSNDHRITTRIDVREFFHVRNQALLAHATQIDPNSPFWFGLPSEVARDVYPWEDWVLAYTADGVRRSEGLEHDLFEGLRA
jgi:mycothiol S-conjugate amidase